jgi:hypothetical protein
MGSRNSHSRNNRSSWLASHSQPCRRCLHWQSEAALEQRALAPARVVLLAARAAA